MHYTSIDNVMRNRLLRSADIGLYVLVKRCVANNKSKNGLFLSIYIIQNDRINVIQLHDMQVGYFTKKS